MEPKEPFPVIDFKYVGYKNLDFMQTQVEELTAKSQEFLDRLAVSFKGINNLMPNDKIFLAQIQIEFHHIHLPKEQGENKYDLIIRHTSQSYFRIENFEEIFVKDENNTFQSDQRVSNYLIGLATSTVRGVLIEKLANSPLSHIILPPVPANALNGPRVFKQ